MPGAASDTAAASKTVAVVGAGVFGLSLALALRKRGHRVTVFDQHAYDETGYRPTGAVPEQAASVDANKIFRASYGTKSHYQRLALESRDAWAALGDDDGGHGLLEPCGMLRVQPTAELGALERETLASLARAGLRDTQFVAGDADDRRRAARLGWADKLLGFGGPGSGAGSAGGSGAGSGAGPGAARFEAVLDSLAGVTRCGDACALFQRRAAAAGVRFRLGPQRGAFAALLTEPAPGGGSRAVGLRTRDGASHRADVVAVAAGSFSTQLLPDLAYHLESSAGSVATFRIDPADTALWRKYGPERFPVVTWKSAPRAADGRDTGSVYALPRTPDGLVKIGYRGIKFTNFQPAPAGTPFTQDGQWSVPLPREACGAIPAAAAAAIRAFVAVFLPEFAGVPFHSTRLCWYTDTLDNSFVIDYVPTYADRSVFVCTGGSGHGAKFLPVLGEHAADILEKGDASTSYMRPFWRWRDDAARGNGLDEGPGGARNLGLYRGE